MGLGHNFTQKSGSQRSFKLLWNKKSKTNHFWGNRFYTFIISGAQLVLTAKDETEIFTAVARDVIEDTGCDEEELQKNKTPWMFL